MPRGNLLRVDDALTDIVSAGFGAGVRFGESIAADMLAVPLGPRQRSAVVASPVMVEVDGPLTLSDQDLMVDAALASAGLAYLFEGQVVPLLAQGRLVRVLEGWCPSYPGFFLYYPSRRQLPTALRAFVDFTKKPGA